MLLLSGLNALCDFVVKILDVLHFAKSNVPCWDLANLDEAIELLSIDEAIFDKANIADREGTETNEFTLFTQMIRSSHALSTSTT